MSYTIADVLKRVDPGATFEAVNAQLPVLQGQQLAIEPTEGGCIASWGVLRIIYLPPDGMEENIIDDGQSTWVVTGVEGVWRPLLNQMRATINEVITGIIDAELQATEVPLAAARAAAEAAALAALYTEFDLDTAAAIVVAQFP